IYRENLDPVRFVRGAPPGYRLPDAIRLGHVVLQVADLERSLLYYTSVIGLAVRDRSAGAAVLAAGSERLVELRGRARPRTLAPRSRLGLSHFAILLPDRASLGRFLRHASAFGFHIGMADHLVSEALYLTDPDGLIIEVYADRPRSTWPLDGDQLKMASDP